MSALAMLAVSIVVSAPQAKLRPDRRSFAATPRSTPCLRDNADSSSRRSSRLAAARVGLGAARVVVVVVGTVVVDVVDVVVVVVVPAVVVLVLSGAVADGCVPAAGSPAQAAATPSGATVSRYRRVSMQAL